MCRLPIGADDTLAALEDMHGAAGAAAEPLELTRLEAELASGVSGDLVLRDEERLDQQHAAGLEESEEVRDDPSIEKARLHDQREGRRAKGQGARIRHDASHALVLRGESLTGGRSVVEGHRSKAVLEQEQGVPSRAARDVERARAACARSEVRDVSLDERGGCRAHGAEGVAFLPVCPVGHGRTRGGPCGLRW